AQYRRYNRGSRRPRVRLLAAKNQLIRAQGGTQSHLLEVTDIHFGYRAPVLDGLTFEVRDGELLALLGPNGAGKTTLIKLIVGLLRPAAGKVVLDGRNLHTIRRRDAARLIGYVAQESAIVFPLTAMEYVLQGRFAQGRLVGFENETDVNEARRVMEDT